MIEPSTDRVTDRMTDSGAMAPSSRTLHDPTFRGFASDNGSGIHPRVLEAIVAANGGHQVAYGDDVYTERLREVVREQFGAQTQVYPVFNGTGANVVALDLMTQRWDAVVCARSAHINVDECGAPEKIAGAKLMPIDTPDGKLTPALVDTMAHGYGDEHHAQPTVLSVTQTTESGTVYRVQELAELVAHAHGKGMRVHLVVSLGGTKNGCLAAEAVLVLNPEAVSRPLFVRKLDAQLPSKMRFTSAQLLALLEDDLWRETAGHANAMAAALANAVRDIDGVTLTREPEANSVFAIIPPDVRTRLQARYPFWVWQEAIDEVRWMCSFDTTPEDIEGFATALREELARG